ncbi:nicotinate phosphoribosyltransferase [Chitinophaga terrae (ex Kim and Jung 2007)]|uniref:Nicotinate phosphoribosyltransferase n=1 Tax=Chitinophaga terrae (ex Kim and Jung 2007) TaxID=408074 RepID=A0A1H4B6G4_9BACT|nr:nicotinate phosphoribosyltransferase [Chitinophaga terrae (ex Kim and Jung 2007)]GEP91197.1 nicotinate phosphoribosyltransferase [Chitinophaga terrae (ex Kim and Jung 2007)]SEA43875.1 nicotinate phosphoribosyltransferase [Chitinophaga terrae (ex Kim and Jung 2007)]
MILTSILDNDFYKFTMQHAVIKLFPKARARYTFINRGKHAFPPGFAEALKAAVNDMRHLQLTAEEKEYLAITCPYLDPTYLDFLQGYRYDPSEVYISQHGNDVEVLTSGYWYRTILWEVPLMSLICELYYRLTGEQRVGDEEVIRITREKIEKYKELGVTVAEFGTRRRYSLDVHRLVVQTLKQYGTGSFIGSSNIYLSMQNGVKPVGTHAHEWFMFHAAKYGFKMANMLGLENWVQIYRGDLGIALSDTYTSTVFFEQFDKKFAKLFDGVRHDSGDPIIFAEKTITHYKKMGIDPLSKTIIFSDGLDYEKVAHIAEHCKGRIGMSFGIGTDFTNDVGQPAMNIVIKMYEALPENAPRWTEVVKLSDTSGKYTGDPKMITLAREMLDIV